MRKWAATLSLSAIAVLGFGCQGRTASGTTSAVAKPGSSAATAKLEPRSGSEARGTAFFTEKDGSVTLVLEVTGLTPGEHAFHLHEKGDCSAADATSAGGHWNPTSEDHGKWGTHPFHRGDVANLVADATGKATLTFSTPLWSIGGDPSRDVVGHALIVHAKADDFKTQPTGDAGGRVACGVVKKD
jgi:Cu-Zn family superoxide dismutase